MSRKIFLDVETTGLYVKDGHRILEVTAIEAVNDVPTGREFHVIVNPERDIPERSSKIHGITAEKVAGKPVFSKVARELRDFVGDSPIVITCRTDPDGYTLDVAFLNMEMEKAGVPVFSDNQWVNIRRWSEALFGNEGATLTAVLKHYQIDVQERGEHSGHGSTLDARLLAEVYPKLLKDYKKSENSKVKSKLSPPTH